MAYPSRQGGINELRIQEKEGKGAHGHLRVKSRMRCRTVINLESLDATPQPWVPHSKQKS
jgi:hypothetical protein